MGEVQPMKTFDEVYETLPGNGWLSREEALLLWEWLHRSAGDVLEVGCHQGRSTVLLASTGRMVHCVDPFSGFSTSDPSGDRIAAAWRENMTSRGIENVTQYRCKVEEWRYVPVGLAYLDGDHSPSGTLSQIVVAQACGAKVIAVHDVNDSGEGLEIKRVCLKLLGPWAARAGRLAVWTR